MALVFGTQRALKLQYAGFVVKDENVNRLAITIQFWTGKETIVFYKAPVHPLHLNSSVL